jgi:predicted TIM-barrel fold metal-dependent hydrolase
LERSDVFDRYPNLKIVVCHCGGAPRRLLAEGDVLDHLTDPAGAVTGSGEAPGGQVGMATTAMEQVERRSLADNLFFDTCSYDPHFLAAAIRQRGPARFAFGTEAPGSGGHLMNPATGRPADDILATLQSLGLSDGDLTTMVHHNPLKVFPLLAKLLS